MAAYNTETVLTVHHWNDTLFSFTTTRNKGLRFRSGHFLMIGLEVEGKPLVRAYSVASPNYEEHLEFLSIKVQDGPLTSRLQKIQVGDPILVSEKSVGTLVIDDLNPGKHLYLFSTGTGLALSTTVDWTNAAYSTFLAGGGDGFNVTQTRRFFDVLNTAASNHGLFLKSSANNFWMRNRPNGGSTAADEDIFVGFNPGQT